MSDVKRYTIDENSLIGGMDMLEDDDGDYVLHSDYATLLARHNALVEAVAWLREVDDVREWLMEFPWLRKWSGLDQCMNEARAEVDRLVADCKGEGWAASSE